MRKFYSFTHLWTFVVPLDTGEQPGRLLNILFTFSLCPASRGDLCFSYETLKIVENIRLRRFICGQKWSLRVRRNDQSEPLINFKANISCTADQQYSCGNAIFASRRPLKGFTHWFLINPGKPHAYGKKASYEICYEI